MRWLAERPATERIIAWNAFSSGPMLGVNVSMGLELVRSYGQWQVSAEVLQWRAAG